MCTVEYEVIQCYNALSYYLYMNMPCLQLQENARVCCAISVVHIMGKHIML